jgi:hypothetical protein
MKYSPDMLCKNCKSALKDHLKGEHCLFDSNSTFQIDDSQMRDELLRSMFFQLEVDWGPNPIECRWCSAWLLYGDNASKGYPDAAHTKTCFAVAVLGVTKEEMRELQVAYKAGKL